MHTNPDPIVTVDEAAAYLGVSEKTVRRLAARGDLEATRLGRLVRFRVSQLEDYLQSVSTDTRAGR